ncbi:galactose mutarotase [Lutibacter sp. B2]|nr:galactose mutarotase [Lutibacter sp. B2]
MYSIKNAFNIEERQVKRISIKNKKNMEVTLLNYGATIVAIWVPDKNGNMENIVLTHEHIEDYIKNPSYFGAIVGRTSGRIAAGKFVLDKKVYDLNKNYGVNQGHGGFKGFSFQVWDYKILEKENNTIVEFTYLSKDGEENYPGNLKVKVIYTLTENNELWIEYEANTDKKTLCNLTNHSYFNVSGNYKRKVTEQYLKIKSNYFLELNRNQISTGKLIDVKNTPMDFKECKLIGKDIECNYEQLIMTNGYDHTWVLNGKKNQIEMIDLLSGRKMIITTTYPSVVVYSYNFPNNEKLKYGNIGSKYDGICFETQYEPDGMNHENLTSAILDVGRKYYEKTEYKFSII